jgi:hypothetical protein
MFAQTFRCKLFIKQSCLCRHLDKRKTGFVLQKCDNMWEIPKAWAVTMLGKFWRNISPSSTSVTKKREKRRKISFAHIKVTDIIFHGKSSSSAAVTLTLNCLKRLENKVCVRSELYHKRKAV